MNASPEFITSSYKRSIVLLASGLLSACCVAMLWVSPASAHVLKIDGTIAAVLHVDPNDEPVSGVPTTYILFMDDSTGKFSLPHCDCTVRVKENGQTIAVQPLKENSQGIIGGSVTFPTPDVYQLIFNGTPTTVGAFQPFTLDYLERVTQGSTNDALSLSSVIWLGVCAIVVIASLVACWLQFTYNSHQGENA